MSTKSYLKSTSVALGAALVLGACVTATPYQQSKGGISSYGYDDVKIEAGKYRVTFRGNSSTDLATVENYILLRAAELTLADGFGHFMILADSESGLRSFNSTSTGFGGGFGGFGRGGFNRGFGGIGTSTTRTRERRSFDVGVVIQAFEGEKDPENIEAFNAQDVFENLSTVAVR
ncbi:MAG: hypothetical protein AAGJ50_08755 [Pseudomonadota bacterium]